MTVERFRSHDEARRALVRGESGDIARRIRAVWSLAAKLSPQGRHPRGVQRFTSIEEAGAERRARQAR